jgi:hypothetical protein
MKSRLADAKNQFYINYTGTFLLKKSDEYKFSMMVSGSLKAIKRRA